ncbi:MAG: hypothetical protein H6718_04215 [Polyangiaceae bacterium]|nr:hypothetical protein [Polyangiaceae bacterium]
MGLNQTERDELVSAKGDTDVITEMMRALAREKRLSDLHDAMTLGAESCEWNRNAKKAHLIGRLPGIISNWFLLNKRSPEEHRAYIAYTLDNNGEWASRVTTAARVSSEEFARVVGALPDEIWPAG